MVQVHQSAGVVHGQLVLLLLMVMVVLVLYKQMVGRGDHCCGGGREAC